MKKLTAKLVAMVASLLAGLLAGVIFKQVWRLAAGEKEAPEATDLDRGWTEVLTAAALQGAIFATVKAATQRATTRRTLPEDED